MNVVIRRSAMGRRVLARSNIERCSNLAQSNAEECISSQHPDTV